MLKNIENKLKEVRYMYKEIVHGLLDTRNKIFNAMNKFQSINKELTQHIELAQVGKFIEWTRNIRSQYKVDIFSTFDIKKVD